MKSIRSRVEYMKFGVDVVENVVAMILIILVILLCGESSRGTPPRVKVHNEDTVYDDLQYFSFAMGGHIMIKMVYQYVHKGGLHFKSKMQRKDNHEKYLNNKVGVFSNFIKYGFMESERQ